MNITKRVKTSSSEYDVEVTKVGNKIRLELYKLDESAPIGGSVKDRVMTAPPSIYTKAYDYNSYTDMIALVSDFVLEYEREGKVDRYYEELMSWDGIITEDKGDDIDEGI